MVDAPASKDAVRAHHPRRDRQTGGHNIDRPLVVSCRPVLVQVQPPALARILPTGFVHSGSCEGLGKPSRQIEASRAPGSALQITPDRPRTRMASGRPFKAAVEGSIPS